MSPRGAVRFQGLLWESRGGDYWLTNPKSFVPVCAGTQVRQHGGSELGGRAPQSEQMEGRARDPGLLASIQLLSHFVYISSLILPPNLDL